MLERKGGDEGGLHRGRYTDMDSINKRKQLFRGRESGQRRGFTKETEGGEKKRHSVLSSTSAVSCPAVKAS